MTQLPQILEHVPPALLVVFRFMGLMIYGPVFGSPAIPVRVKIFLAFLIGIAVYPVVSAAHPASEQLTLDLWSLAPRVATELIIGLIIGYVASLPMMAMQTSGLIMGQQMGLGFARFFDPAIDDEADIVGQVLFYMALAGFLMIGGHEAMILAVLDSFQHVPLGGFTIDNSVIELVAGLLLAAFELALRVAAPLLAIIFLESIAMGFVSKTVPQLNILSLGFPLRIMAGFLILALGMIVIDEVLMDGIDQMLQALFTWIGQ